MIYFTFLVKYDFELTRLWPNELVFMCIFMIIVVVMVMYVGVI